MGGADVQRRGTQIGDIRFDDPQTTDPPSAHRRLLKRHVLADASPTRNIPISKERLSFVATRSSEPSLKKAKREEPVESQTLYHEFMSLDQAGPAIMAFDSTSELFAIKKYKSVASDEIKNILSTQYSETVSVVSVIEAFQTTTEVHIVYERMDVSLRHILATPRGQLVSHEIGAICREVIQGLLYLHKNLRLFHGAMDCGQVLVNRLGHVKIGKVRAQRRKAWLILAANVGESMLRSRQTNETHERKDIRDLGLMMVEMMEPETSLMNAQTLDLRSSERWEEATGIKSFLNATKTSSLQDLRNHPFLPPESTSACLKAHVLMAQVSAQINWTIFSQTL